VYTPWGPLDGKSGADDGCLKTLGAAYKAGGGTEPAGCKNAPPVVRKVAHEANTLA
jgi:hypothetical protein